MLHHPHLCILTFHMVPNINVFLMVNVLNATQALKTDRTSENGSFHSHPSGEFFLLVFSNWVKCCFSHTAKTFNMLVTGSQQIVQTVTSMTHICNFLSFYLSYAGVTNTAMIMASAHPFLMQRSNQEHMP